MSSTEAEYIDAAKASMEAVWMRKFIDGLGGVMPLNKRPMEMLCDNKPALAIASDPRILKGAIHFQRKYHYIRESIFSSYYLFRNPFSSTTIGEKNPIRTLGDYSKPSQEAIGIPSSSLQGTTWTTKLRNVILMFQQHHGESLSEAWTHFKDLLQKVPHHGIDLWLQAQIFYDHVNPITRRTIDQSTGGKLRDLNAEESYALLEDLTLYDNESWNDPRNFAKLVKAIALPQDVLSTSDRRLIELKNQVQCLMEAHLAPTQPTQANKITT
ncbi:hypothetical protein Tco_0911401 [Tanacetum coccineum]|uniref:Retrotransposon gag domain-containing protein n=1 Tax=Tanacetum coccineum TaxID=301880 RepID=A0ABQ5CYV7_9ASTR